jgi:methyl-accepting chemotaxis protein
MAEENIGGTEFLKKLVGESADLLGNIGRIQDGISDINRSFGETRTRYLEFSTAVSDSVADFVRLGGEAKDVSATITGIAEASRRNVVASRETLTEIFATAKYLGSTAEAVTESFAIAGVEMSNIAEATEESVDYIQSIGLNARTIMGDVALRMEYMNRFNFEGGVLGLSKMAAQASMLRFDMTQTAEFADKVLNPEGAIQMASAFQRLGVASGDLVDPFILMDKSINDPEGLQDSIIELAKQFTIFDEKTGNFRINPGGVRLLKELQEQTGLSYENMTKTALAAADLDRRLSQISFDVQGSEEDKMLVANMAKMGDKGKFYVEFQDEQGQKQTKALEDLTDAQFQQIKQQAALRPETMEEIARAQLDTDLLIAADIGALPTRLGYAIAGQSGLTRGIESLREGFDNFAKEVYAPGAVPTTEEFREAFQDAGDTLKGAAENLIKGTGSVEDVQDALKRSIEQGTVDLSVASRLQKVVSAFENMESGRERFRQLGIGEGQDERYKSWETYSRQQRQSGEATVTGQVEVMGDINIKVDSPNTLTDQQIFSIFNNPEVKDNIYRIVKARTDAAIKEFKNN